VAEEAQFTILKYRDKIPILAVRRLWDLKFLTPREVMKNVDAAEVYLREKYRLHDCKHPYAEPRKWHP
jgi:hypothetical protein